MNTTSAGPVQERPTIDELCARAQALVPVLRERAARAEELRRLPDETIDDLEEAGLFLVCAARDRGGYGYGPTELCQVSRVLARGCVSTGWIYSFMGIYILQLTQDVPHLLGDRAYVRAALSAGAHLAPSGTAVPVDGGWRVTGRWPYASGVLHAEYVMFITTETSDAPPDGPPSVLGLVCDASQAKIDDDWKMSGMAATGSNSFELDDVFVPADQQWNVLGLPDPDAAPDPATGEPPAKFAVIGDFGLVFAACAIGAAEAAVEAFGARIHTRVMPMNGGPQREHREAWARYGQAFTEARLARVFMEESLRITSDFLGRRVRPTQEQIAILKMATARMTKAAADAIEIVVEGSGSSVYRLADPLQRQRRDVGVIKSHALTTPDGAYVPSGQVLLDLGQPSDFMFNL